MASDATGRQTDFGEKLVYWLALLLVIVGLLNAMPGIPGIDDAFAGFLGFKNFVIRKYPYEYFYPLAFALMMIIVALKHSLWRGMAEGSPTLRKLGLALDAALIVAAIAISVTYMVEIWSIKLAASVLN